MDASEIYKSLKYHFNMLTLLPVFSLFILCPEYIGAQSNLKQFPGGDKAYKAFLKNNLVLPEHVASGETEGVVKIKFDVSEKGIVTNIRVTESMDSLCDSEAIRLATTFPKLEATKKSTTPVRSSQTLSILFCNYQHATYIHKSKNLQEYINDNLNRPVEADDNEAGSKVMVSLFINKEGEMQEASILESLSPECDQAALELANKMKIWKPAQNGAGESIDSHYKLSVPFNGKLTLPQYPGGEKKMLDFIGKNLVYPSDAEQRNIQGRVIVRFTVDISGEIQDAEVVGNVYPSLDIEALRVVNKMPKWKPGLVGNKPERIFFTIPIHYRLRDKTKENKQIHNNNTSSKRRGLI